jgi:hypothetical protein
VATTDVWTYRDSAWTGTALIGMSVEAIDGEAGKVEGATDDAGGNALVVDTGAWIFGKKVFLPAGVVDRVDFDTETIFVSRTKDEIKNAPEYDDSKRDDPAFRRELGSYYARR